MTDRLPQERWPLDITHPATRGEASSLALPPRYPLSQPASTKPVPFPHTGPTCFDVSEAPLSVPPILVIDDSPTIRKILEVTHRRQGFSLQTFADGVEALRWLQSHPTMIPSLVYLDICMPRLDGYEVAHHLHSRPHFSAVPIVMLSGKDGVLDRLKGRLVGATGYITKPFRSEEILTATRHYLSTGRPTSGASWEHQHDGESEVASLC